MTVIVKTEKKKKRKVRKIRNFFRTVLRFLNLIEPDTPYTVLSLSKISVWITLAMTVYVLKNSEGTTEVAGALIANVGSIANYAYRRHIQVKTGTGTFMSNNAIADPNCTDNGCADDNSDEIK